MIHIACAASLALASHHGLAAHAIHHTAPRTPHQQPRLVLSPDNPADLPTPRLLENAAATKPQSHQRVRLDVAQDSSGFTLAHANKADLACLASLPIVWASMVLLTRILSDTAGVSPVSPALCVFGTQLVSMPIMLAKLAHHYSGGADADAHADDSPDDDLALVLKVGIVLGGLWAVGGLIQTSGFEAGASASHGAFLTQLTTLIVPLLQLLRGDKLAVRFIVGCAFALPGIACFAFDSSAAASSSTLQGDTLCALSALAYSTYDIFLAGTGGSVEINKLNVVRATVGTVGAGLLAVYAGDGIPAMASLCEQLGSPASAITEAVSRASVAPTLADAIVAVASVPAIGIALLAVANAVSAGIQPKAHAAVPPAVSQIFYAQTPLWASVLSFTMLHESFSSTALLGVAFFTGSLLVSSSPDEAVKGAIMGDRNSPQRRLRSLLLKDERRRLSEERAIEENA